MNQSLALTSLLVADYDAAIAFYTGALGFDLVEDTPLGPTKRWVIVRPKGGSGGALLLAEERAAIGVVVWPEAPPDCKSSFRLGARLKNPLTVAADASRRT